MFNKEVKFRDLTKLSNYRDSLMKEPRLRYLFLELTLRCNENCLHCGSRCNEVRANELSVRDYEKFLYSVKKDLGTDDKMLNITGGEPLLRQDFFDIMSIAKDLGFKWGMTSNATLIDEKCAHLLREVGMGTISVSIDGLPDTHDGFRRVKDGYKRAMRGINCLISEGGFKSIQITTVATHKSINELESLYEIFDKLDIDSWRIIGIEPMGRALDHPELLLTPEDYNYLFNFIRDMRIKGEPVTYGCSHYLGLEYEREVRDWYYLCMAGIQTASITCNGDIIACLDIERRPEFIQGNILTDNFSDVWFNKFGNFRRNLCDSAAATSKCSSCTSRNFCHGGPFHSWNHDTNEPRICLRDILFT